MKELTMVGSWLLVLGGLNLGLNALMGVDLLGQVLGSGGMLSRLVNILIGASAVWMAYSMLGMKKARK